MLLATSQDLPPFLIVARPVLVWNLPDACLLRGVVAMVAFRLVVSERKTESSGRGTREVSS